MGRKLFYHFTKLLVCFYFPALPQRKTQYALNKRERVCKGAVILFYILMLRVLDLGDLIKFLGMPISKTEYRRPAVGYFSQPLLTEQTHARD